MVTLGTSGLSLVSGPEVPTGSGSRRGSSPCSLPPIPRRLPGHIGAPRWEGRRWASQTRRTRTPGGQGCPHRGDRVAARPFVSVSYSTCRASQERKRTTFPTVAFSEEQGRPHDPLVCESDTVEHLTVLSPERGPAADAQPHLGHFSASARQQAAEAALRPVTSGLTGSTGSRGSSAHPKGGRWGAGEPWGPGSMSLELSAATFPDQRALEHTASPADWRGVAAEGGRSCGSRATEFQRARVDVEGTECKEGLALLRVWAGAAKEEQEAEPRPPSDTGTGWVTALSCSYRPALPVLPLRHHPGPSPSLATGQVGAELPSIVGSSASRVWGGGQSVTPGTGTGGREAATRLRSAQSPADPPLVPRQVPAGGSKPWTSPPAPPGLYALGRDTPQFSRSPPAPCACPSLCWWHRRGCLLSPCSDPSPGRDQDPQNDRASALKRWRQPSLTPQPPSRSF